jgi:hypothetical protein
VFATVVDGLVVDPGLVVVAGFEGFAGKLVVVGLGVGVGLGSTVRVRLDGAVVLLFCANRNAVVAKTIESMATDLFIFFLAP